MTDAQQTKQHEQNALLAYCVRQGFPTMLTELLQQGAQPHSREVLNAILDDQTPYASTQLILNATAIEHLCEPHFFLHAGPRVANHQDWPNLLRMFQHLHSVETNDPQNLLRHVLKHSTFMATIFARDGVPVLQWLDEQQIPWRRYLSRVGIQECSLTAAAAGALGVLQYCQTAANPYWGTTKKERNALTQLLFTTACGGSSPKAIPVLQWALQQGADPSSGPVKFNFPFATCSQYKWPLIHAIDHNNVEVVNFLIQQGVDVNLQGASPLHMALRENKSAIAKALLNAGAFVTQASLQAAGEYHEPDMVKLVLQHQPDDDLLDWADHNVHRYVYSFDKQQEMKAWIHQVRETKILTQTAGTPSERRTQVRL